jgi:GYF domain 2
VARGLSEPVPQDVSGGVTHWFIQRGEQKLGPLAAADIARMMDAGELDWSSLVWRDGLPDWCAVKADQALTTALLAVRGAFADTHVFQAPPALRADDTIVDPLPVPPGPHVLALGTPSVSSAARELSPLADHGEPSPPPPGEPLAPSARAPGLADTGPQPVVPRSPVPHSWMPSVRSMLLVAGLAFLFGVVVAALWGRLLRSRPAREEIVVPTLRLGEVRDPIPAPQPVPTAAPTPQPVTAPQRGELALDALRSEVRRVSSDVHRCLTAPSEGVQVDATIDSESGRVRDVRLTASRLSAGVHTCVVQAVRQIQVPPFSGDAHKLSHRFVW